MKIDSLDTTNQGYLCLRHHVGKELYSATDACTHQTDHELVPFSFIVPCNNGFALENVWRALQSLRLSGYVYAPMYF